VEITKSINMSVNEYQDVTY